MKQVISNVCLSFAMCLLLFAVANSVFAQAPNGDFAASRERVIQMINDNKFAESFQLFEKLAADKQAQTDAQIFFGYGIAALYKADEIKDAAARKQMRLKARTALVRAKDLGLEDAQLDQILNGIKPDGGEQGRSDNPEANRAMDAAFEPFKTGDYKKAAEFYGKAAALDPTLYEAALYTGNSYYSGKQYDQAGIWFAKAIAINPNRETAHRYWADAYMFAGKNAEAQNKFFDAIIAEPYNQLAWRGLNQFANRQNIKIGHPKIQIPADVSTGANGNVNITLGVADKDQDDGSFAWTFYGLSHAAWQTGKAGKPGEKFAKAFPNEKVYRHSLAEEADALRGVLTVLKTGKKPKTLNSSLVNLQKLNDAGLLEAYILLARADAGIRRDYEVYRQNNSDKIKRYLAEFMIQNSTSTN